LVGTLALQHLGGGTDVPPYSMASLDDVIELRDKILALKGSM
jgi:hypothetical protein